MIDRFEELNSVGLDYNDLLCVPVGISDITSRHDGIQLPKMLPLFTAPMDTVVDLSNLDKFIDNNIFVTLPRTIKINEIISNKTYLNNINKVFISVGFKELDIYYKSNFKIFPLNANILIDVANGHMSKISNYTKEIRRLRPDIVIMVGNIANPETYTYYANSNSVDYIRVGIGNGNGCLTTQQTGVGYPMASLINEVYKAKLEVIESNNLAIEINKSRGVKEKKEKVISRIPKIVADGGIKNYSDAIKALGLGADYVMLGSVFNKSLESAGENRIWGIKIKFNLAKKLFKWGFPVKKYFRGMSTKSAQKSMGNTKLKTSEGVVRYRKVEYYLTTWVSNFNDYLLSAMSYSGSVNLSQFIGKAKFIKISKNSYERFNK